MLNDVIAWLMLGFAGVQFVFTGLYPLWKSLALWRQTAPGRWREFTRIVAHSHQGMGVLVTGMGLLSIVPAVIVALGLEPRGVLLATSLLLGFASLLYTFRPPAVLLLASSCPESAELLETITRAIAPLRVVSLLDAGRFGRMRWRIPGRDNLRVPESVAWEAVVHALVDIVPMIVVDGRLETEQVLREMQRVLENPFRVERCLVLTHEGARSPVLERLEVDPARVLTIDSVQGLVSFLRVNSVPRQPGRYVWQDGLGNWLLVQLQGATGSREIEGVFASRADAVERLNSEPG